jgi:tetratricopeptide (TPR) repeat protein
MAHSDHSLPVSIGIAVALCAMAACGRGDPCADAFDRQRWPDAIAACRGDAIDDRLRLAQAHMYQGEYPHSAAVAAGLLARPLTTAQAAMVHRVLGRAEEVAERHAAAAIHYATALALRASTGADREVARESYGLGVVMEAAGAYDEALRVLTVARDAAIRAGDRKMQGYAEFMRAHVVRSLGDVLATERTLEVAAGLLAPYCDRVHVLTEQGWHQFAQGHATLARDAYRRVLDMPAACLTPELRDRAHAMLAWIAVRQDDLAAADAHLEGIATSDADMALIRASADLLRGDPGSAATRLREAEVHATDATWGWLVPLMLAQVEELRGQANAAEAAYRRAIAAVVRVRAGSRSQAAYVVASHRMPYEGLFGLLARAGRWRDALALIAGLDASDLLQVTSTPGLVGIDGVGKPAAGAGPPVATRGTGTEQIVDVDRIVRAWRGRDLVVVVAPAPRAIAGVPDRIWRLRIVDGEVRGEDVGDAAELEALADRLLGAPRDAEAAVALGRAIVPAGAAPLYVLTVGSIGRAPLAALRDADGWVLARRPLLRVLGLQPRTARVAHGTGALVLGDPRRDLRAAADEARWVADQLGTTAWTGGDATIGRLLAARSVDVLHLAAHTNEQAARRVIHLADGDLAAETVIAGGVAPRLVVLASCGSAAARDEGGWGSLAAGFIAAGSDAVVATHWSVEDVATAELVRGFYAAGGTRDPARALAAAQVAASQSSSTSWAAFTLIAAPPHAN